MKVVRPMRARHGSKRLDVSQLRDLLKDHRLWVSLGIVSTPEDGGQHWELVPGADGSTDINVEVLLAPSNVSVTARLGGAAGGAGIWQVPPLGAEVVVNFPDGRLDWMPVIVAQLSTGNVPNPNGQGPSPTNLVIAVQPGSKVFVHDGTGGAAELATKADLEAHVSWAQSHRHAGLLGGTGSAAALTSAPASSPAGTSDPPPEPVGTEVLLAR